MTHTHALRVYYEDTDAGGVVYHARYLAFAERARTEMLRELGLTHVEFLGTYGLIFVVRRVEVDYQRPARLDDRLLVRTTVQRKGGASCDLLQELARDDGTVAVVSVRLACVRATDGRPARWPERWDAVLAGQRNGVEQKDG